MSVRTLFFASAAAVAAIFSILACNAGFDPVVVIVTPNADTLRCGVKVDYSIFTLSAEGQVERITVTSFNEEQGRVTDAEIPVGKTEWHSHWVGETPVIQVDTLKHRVTFTALDSTGAEAEWSCTLVLYRPKESAD